MWVWERAYYTTLFRDGACVTTWGTCAADAGSRALRIRDAERGDRLAVVEKIVPEPDW